MGERGEMGRGEGGTGFSESGREWYPTVEENGNNCAGTYPVHRTANRSELTACSRVYLLLLLLTMSRHPAAEISLWDRG